ncbi:hypothetical protein ACIBIZ_14020 [Nonomuraea spiralis]|uniref:Uncharacterized protein n=1 Tax=Nonomuraea spiralis TaxID=46182 RepID=A0ABV5IX00_9ACTN|nr:MULTISPECIES: hypothetical protein [Nonomuraea]
MTRWADRLLEKVAPHTVASATDCGYDCCNGNIYAAWCCSYPNGTYRCGICTRYRC